ATQAAPLAQHVGPPAPPVSLEAPFFQLLAAAGREDESWSRLLTGFEGLGMPRELLLGSLLRVQEPNASPELAQRLLQTAAPRASGKSSSARPSASDAVTSLAQLVQRADLAADSPRLARGVLFDASTARASRRGALDAAVDRLARHSLESLSPADLAR